MQKNNCKLKTIFKKGLSFSIALALGAAATSLNLAKTAEATKPAFSGARSVYLAGEAIDCDKGKASGDATHVKINGAGDYLTGSDLTNYKLTTDVTSILYSDGTNDADAATAVTVYDWAKIYDSSKTLKVVHNTTDVQTLLGSLSFSNLTAGQETAHSTALRDLLKSGTVTVAETDVKLADKFDYAKHDGQAISVKVGDVVCPLGTLEVDRSGALESIELLSGPTEYCYIAGETINLAGLAIKLNYSVGDSETVAWTEENDSEFAFSSGDVGNDKEITATISDVTVTYDEKTTDEEFTLYVCKNLSKEAGNIAKVDGVFDKLDVVNAIALSENKDNYKKLKDDFSDDNAQVIYAYDITANYNASVGKMRVALSVGKNYAGQVVTVKHLLDDGKIETFVDKVDEDGNVTVSVDSLSPFMIVLGATEEDKAAAAETEQKNAEAAETETAKTEAAKAEAAKAAATAATTGSSSKSASSSVKTGDASVVAFSVFGFVALISAAVLAFMKKNRKNFEK